MPIIHFGIGSNVVSGPGKMGGGSPPSPPTQPPPAPDPFYLLFLQRWNEEVRPLEGRSFESQKIGADFGKVALTSSVILNGGALVALPTLMQWLNPNGRSLVGNMAMWFPFGLGCVFIALLAAYINFMCISAGYMCLATIRARELSCGYNRTTPDTDPDWRKANKDHKRMNFWTRFTQIVAVGSALLSFIFFALGVWGFIELASYSYLPK